MPRGKGFNAEFKAKAMALAQEIGVMAAAPKLGVCPGVMRKWLDRYAKGQDMKKKDSPERQAVLLAEREVKRLKKENEELKKANWILKEVAKVFSKDPLESAVKRSLNSPAKGPKK
jgi:transposase-like protein